MQLPTDGDSAEDCQAEIISDSPGIAENENADIKEGGCSTAENVTDHNLRGKKEKVDIKEGGCSTAENTTDHNLTDKNYACFIRVIQGTSSVP